MFSVLNSLLVDSVRFAVKVVNFGMEESFHQYSKDISVYSCQVDQASVEVHRASISKSLCCVARLGVSVSTC